MTLEDLRIFTAAVEAGSLGQAARALGLSQPAVAHHVRRLEQELEGALVDRSSRGISLTEAGRAFYERVSAALGALGTGVSEFAAIRERSEGAVSLAASSGAVRHYLKPALMTLRRRRPNLDLRLVCANTRAEQLDAVRRRRAEIAFISLSGDVEGFAQRPVATMPYVLVVHRDDPLARHARVGIERLAEIRYVAVGEESVAARHVDAALAKRGERIRVAEVVDTEGTAILWAELGLGHILLPRIQSRALENRSELRTIEIRGLPPAPVGWVARDFALLSGAAREMLDIVDRAAARWTGAGRKRQARKREPGN